MAARLGRAMSLLTSRIGFRHRCVVQRDDNAATDDGWGNPQTPDWQDHLTDVPCRVVVDAGREPVDSDRTVVLVDMRLLVPLDTDVTESDRVSEITERGDDYVDAPLVIEAILRRRTHLELALRRIS
jgi:hypothetical protein